jgi:hypothetical protein
VRRRVVLLKTDVSKERVASIFKVENQSFIIRLKHFSSLAYIYSILKIEATRSSETSVSTRPLLRHIP